MKKRNRNVEKDSISEFVASNVNKFRSVVTTHAKTTRDEDKTIQNASKKVASALGFTGVEQKAAITQDALELIKTNIMMTLQDSNMNTSDENINNNSNSVHINKMQEKLNILKKYVGAIKHYTPYIQNAIITKIIEWCPSLNVDDVNNDYFTFTYPQEICNLYFQYNKDKLKVIDILKLSIKNPFVFQYYCHQKLRCLTNEDKVNEVVELYTNNDATLKYYLKHPFLNIYFMHEAYSLYLSTGSKMFLKLIILMKSKLEISLLHSKNTQEIIALYFSKELHDKKVFIVHQEE